MKNIIFTVEEIIKEYEHDYIDCQLSKPNNQIVLDENRRKKLAKEIVEYVSDELASLAEDDK